MKKKKKETVLEIKHTIQWLKKKGYNRLAKAIKTIKTKR